MEKSTVIKNTERVPGFLSGGGPIESRILEYRWANTSLGPIEIWPQSLRVALSICLNSNFPIAIYWGPDLILLYNEAWSPIPGNKHPWALGKPAREVWPEIWEAIEPQFQKAFQGEPGGSKNALLPMERHGYKEECYFDFTFTPIYGDGGRVEGVFNAVIETTRNILNERQLQTLTALGKALIDSRTSTQVIDDTINTLYQNRHDFPFALFRTIEGTNAILAAGTPGLQPGQIEETTDLSKESEMAACINSAISTRAVQVLPGIKAKLGDLPMGAWSASPDRLITVAVTQAGAKEPYGVLQVGQNPLRSLDENYISFFKLIADQMAAAFSQVNSAEEERKRAAALAEVDRAKTAFFTNISHEFRTPLTLLLGSMEETLNDPGAGQKTISQLQVAHRNAMRLLKLVNSLLDFSRLEAGRLKASFQLTNLAEFTKGIASNFRSAIEKGGLQFVVESDAFLPSVYVDREMWEKVVTNLLSNAFKYTLSGRISLALTASESAVELRVTDTGIGIPASELSNVFQRFHRVQHHAGRTFEGTGIGLSLVKELVQLQGGRISVSSEERVGTEFRVQVPIGKTHIDPSQIAKNELELQNEISTTYIEEFESTISRDEDEPGLSIKKDRETVLVVDDNPDMRDHLRSLLKNKYNVISASNGLNALHKMKEQGIDLVVSDIMMPIMDGIRLLRQIKDDPATSAIPVILLSARAGDEAKVEGFDVGADDYLIKPFSSKELFARIGSQINMAKKRQGVLNDVYRLFDQTPFAVAVLKGESLTIDYINQFNLTLWQCDKREVIGKPLFEARPDIKATAEAIHKEVYRTGKRFTAKEAPIDVMTNGKIDKRYFNVVIDPMLDEQGRIIGQLASSIDVTDEVVARRQMEESAIRLQAVRDQLDITFRNVPSAIYMLDSAGNIVFANEKATRLTGNGVYENGELTAENFLEKLSNRFLLFSQDGQQIRQDRWMEVLAIQPGETADLPMKAVDKVTREMRWLLVKAGSVREADLAPGFLLVIITDITKQAEAEIEVRSLKEQLELTIENVPSAVYLFDNEGHLLYVNKLGLESMRKVLGDQYNPTDDYGTMLGKARGNAEYFDQDGNPLLPAALSTANAMASVKEREIIIKRVMAGTGEVNWILNRATPVLDSGGKIKYMLTTNTDITGQKKAQEEIKAGKERLQAALDASQTGTFRWNIRTNELEWDDNLERLFGLLPGQEVKSLEKFIQRVHPDDRQAVIAACELCATKGSDFEMEYRVVVPDGTIRWLYDKGKAHLDERNSPDYMTGACVDVTPYKLAAEEVKASEERFEAAVNAVQGILWTNNEKGEMEGDQPGWAALTGQTYEEYQGYGWSKAIHPDDAQPTITAWHKALANKGLFLFEHRVRRIDGSWGQYSIRAIPILREDGSIREWVGVHTDVTRERNAEQALRQSEEKFRMLAETLPNLIWMTNSAGDFEYASRQWYEYSGVNPADENSWRKIVHADDMEIVTAAWTTSLSTGNTYQAEVRLKNSVGEYRWHVVQGEPVRDAAGNILKWIGAFTDIHDRKSLTESLERVVADRTRELQRSNADLLQFAHVASHDLKEPVRKVRTFALRLKDEFGDQISDKAQSFLTKIDLASLRMHSMIEGVLMYSSVDVIKEDSAPVPLDEVIQQIANDLEILIEQKAAVIKYQALPVIVGLPILTHQLFYNLISNSLKFTKPNVSPVIRLFAENVGQWELEKCHLSPDKKYVKIILEDNGIGFSQSDVERLFEPFSRLHSKDKFEGTGLGLALCRKIVDRLGGAISAQGKEARGARFEIILVSQ